VRIDKYLKVSRILKRRTVSKELALNQRIEINGKVVKPSHEVMVGDIVGVTFGNRKMEVRVLSVQEVKRKAEASDMYEIVSESRINNSEVIE
jgi:ribosomal 50S subunit-recycling heat shock protein